MTYKTEPVPLPSEAKFLIFAHKYVYWYNNAIWGKAKKVMRDNRVLIGRLVPGKPGLMYPNEMYEELFVRKSDIGTVEASKKISHTLCFGGL